MAQDRVELVKTNGTLGALPVGSRYPWTYKSITRAQAIARAFRALKRDHPGENPMCWKLSEETNDGR